MKFYLYSKTYFYSPKFFCDFSKLSKWVICPKILGTTVIRWIDKIRNCWRSTIFRKINPTLGNFVWHNTQATLFPQINLVFRYDLFPSKNYVNSGSHKYLKICNVILARSSSFPRVHWGKMISYQRMTCQLVEVSMSDKSPPGPPGAPIFWCAWTLLSHG